MATAVRRCCFKQSVTIVNEVSHWPLPSQFVDLFLPEALVPYHEKNRLLPVFINGWSLTVCK